MKLRTSFFNKTVLVKDLTRFAPVWALYTVLLVIGQLTDGMVSHSIPRDINNILQMFAVYNLIYAGTCAVLLFGDLFKARLCNALHAMPLRREGWFLTHTVSGLLFGLIPYVSLCLIQLSQIGRSEYWFLAFFQLAVALLEYVLYFGIGTLCVMCAGNAVGAIAAYFGGIFFAPICLWLASSLFDIALQGVPLPESTILRLCPAIQLSDDFISCTYDKILGWEYLGIEAFQVIYLGIACAVGMAAWVLGLVLYRRRKLESAGDFLAFRGLAPVFLVMYTLCVGTVFMLFGSNENYLLLLVGLGIGFFTGKMLLEGTLRVFRGKAWLQLGALVAALAVGIWLLWLDPLGTIHRVPEATQVNVVKVYGNYGNTAILMEQEEIEDILDIHETLAEKRHESHSTGTSFWVTFTYIMNDGSTYSRSYWVENDSQEGQVLGWYFTN